MGRGVARVSRKIARCIRKFCTYHFALGLFAHPHRLPRGTDT
ncbi:hypothetical protein AERO9AM_50049 [Aeromicrobium sp. 9AM]|nr:hypothetical protein AERO9AM_50049 [Aeromicrobium sp. 9AM]